MVVRTTGGTAGGGRNALLRRLRAAAREGLPPAARPVRYLLVDDLPRTAGGKVDLQRVAALLAPPLADVK